MPTCISEDDLLPVTLDSFLDYLNELGNMAQLLVEHAGKLIATNRNKTPYEYLRCSVIAKFLAIRIIPPTFRARLGIESLLQQVAAKRLGNPHQFGAACFPSAMAAMFDLRDRLEWMAYRSDDSILTVEKYVRIELKKFREGLGKLEDNNTQFLEHVFFTPFFDQYAGEPPSEDTVDLQIIRAIRDWRWDSDPIQEVFFDEVEGDRLAELVIDQIGGLAVNNCSAAIQSEYAMMRESAVGNTAPRQTRRKKPTGRIDDPILKKRNAWMYRQQALNEKTDRWIFEFLLANHQNLGYPIPGSINTVRAGIRQHAKKKRLPVPIAPSRRRLN
jgi:hypothetical protein